MKSKIKYYTNDGYYYIVWTNGVKLPHFVTKQELQKMLGDKKL